MGDYDLDMEILAAVAGPGDGITDGSPGVDSESGDGFDDDGSGDDFDDSESDSQSEDDADDEDDNDETLHPDDPDYDGGAGAKKAMKATVSRVRGKMASVQNSRKKKPEATKARPKKSRAPAKPRAVQSADIEDDMEGEASFEYLFDEQGYGDADDRAKVNAMNEIERETLLAERVEERQRQERIWMMTRQMHSAAAKKTTARSSSRVKPVKARTDAALEALHSDKLAKKTSRRPVEDLSDDESDAGERSKRQRRSDDDEAGDQSDDVGGGDMYEEGKPMQYEDLVVQSMNHGETKVDPTHLFLPRDRLCELMGEPYFERAVEGLFVRLKRSTPNKVIYYLLCIIDAVQTEGIYKVKNAAGVEVKTNRYLTLRIGNDRLPNVEIKLLSNSVPYPQEFETYSKRLLEQGQRVLNRLDVSRLLDHAKKMTSSKKKPQPTAEEIDRHIKNQEVLFPEKMNWTERKGTVSLKVDHIRAELENAKPRGNEPEIAALQMLLQAAETDLEKIEARLNCNTLSRSQQLFTSMARKNEALNSENERLAASRRAMETTVDGVDPFARFDTTGMSYFSIKSQKTLQDAAIDNDSTGAKRPVPNQSLSRPIRSVAGDWKLALATWQPAKTHLPKSSLGSTPLLSAYGSLFHGLDDFALTSSQLEAQYPVVGFAPPAVDALYLQQVRVVDDSTNLVNGKSITLEEYKNSAE
jgi:Plus-3 domain